ncbi:sulfurtransferase [Corynebacterium mendelii]|uniref:Sulfurtransferase n=1 Tax=Corynebacterium mendelii TaxID=2765362 RepID=A0A939IWD8_9CORY|nr:sulfurtransferase [Corynebacterium mendelii]MBN9645186.1 sulfurtransferase [Corynebacterium mendelii]
MSLTISVDELAETIRSGGKTTILACIWHPGAGMSYSMYRGAHIPTALHCDPAYQLAMAPSARDGRNPLPSYPVLDRAFNDWGLNRDHKVVVYDDNKGLLAARAWWILTWAGVADVSIVEGGSRAWVKAGYEQVGGPGNLARDCTIRPNPGQLPTVDMDYMRRVPDDVLVIDTRENNRYIGRKERLDLKAGHIPGAVNLPLESLMTDDGFFLPEDDIRAAFDAVGVTDPTKVVVYSGSGLHSAAAIFAMHHVGLPGAAQYVGGWSQWSATPDNPVQRGI